MLDVSVASAVCDDERDNAGAKPRNQPEDHHVFFCHCRIDCSCSPVHGVYLYIVIVCTNVLFVPAAWLRRKARKGRSFTATTTVGESNHKHTAQNFHTDNQRNSSCRNCSFHCGDSQPPHY